MRERSARLVELARGVYVRTALRARTNTTVVDLGGGDCLLVDPAMEPHDLLEIAELLDGLSLRVRAGWSTHPHWDHVLWSSRFGAATPRYATAANAALCATERQELAAYLERECPGHETELCGVLTPLGSDGSPLGTGCEVLEHRGHAPGHGALFLEEAGVLLAGDMVSDIEIPTLDLDQVDPLGDYDEALDLFRELSGRVAAFVPGHGAPGDQGELLRRIDLDRRYVEGLRSGVPTSDPRRGEPWLVAADEAQRAFAARGST